MWAWRGCLWSLGSKEFTVLPLNGLKYKYSSDGALVCWTACQMLGIQWQAIMHGPCPHVAQPLKGESASYKPAISIVRSVTWRSTDTRLWLGSRFCLSWNLFSSTSRGCGLGHVSKHLCTSILSVSTPQGITLGRIKWDNMERWLT